MNEESYDFKREPEIFYYEFLSEGPNGIIRKVIQYQQLSVNGNVYNLGFGDFDEQSGQVSDLSVSNNLDTQKILATVAKTVLDFMEQHPRQLLWQRGVLLLEPDCIKWEYYSFGRK